MTIQLDDLRTQTELIEKRLKERREDTGVHRVNTDALANAIDDQFATAARLLWKRARNWGLGILAALGLTGGGIGTWLQSTSAAAVAPVDVQRTVEAEAKAHTEAIDANARGVADANEKIRKVTGIVIELGDEQAENTEYLGRKIDAISPKARRVEPPKAVERRKQKKEAEHLEQRIDDVLGPKE